jgi:hypothetical protein
MANRWCDGFGRYGGSAAAMLNGSSSNAWAEITTGASGWALSSANPRTGNWHLRMTDGVLSPIARRVFGDPLSEVLFGQAVYFETLPTVEPAPGGSENGFFLAKFRTQANLPQIAVFVGTDGAIVVYQHGETEFPFSSFSGTLLGRSAPVVGAGAYQHFEHYLKVGNSDGAYELRINEVTVLNLTGIDTDYQNAAEVSQVTVGREYGGPAFGSLAKHVDMADCYINDTDADGSGCDSFVGDVKSGVRMVNGDTAQADFAKSTGSVGYSLLDDIPPDDADYISTASTTAESDFGFANGPSNISEVLTTRPFVRAKKDDAGTCTIAPSMISAGDKAVVTGQPITTAFAYYDNNVPFNPDTGVPWTGSEVDAALMVVERTA